MNRLNDKQIKAAEPKTRKYTLADGGGLCFLISPRGGKWWRFEYRFGGKKKELSLGTYPALCLKDDRDLRDTNRTKVALRVDPMAERNAEKAARSKKVYTFRDILTSLIADWIDVHVPDRGCTIVVVVRIVILLLLLALALARYFAN